MPRYEYRVVPAPTGGVKIKGVKTTEGRFAHALQLLMNELGAEGWEYLRADTLPCEERSGLTGRVTKYQNMLVFQRVIDVEKRTEVAGFLEAPKPTAGPAPAAPEVPAQSNTAHGPSEPRLTRDEGNGDGPDTASAARAAAAALRPFRADAPAVPPVSKSEPGVAAE